MDIVIDANIVAGYFKESVLGIAIGPKNDLTGSVIPLFEGLGTIDVCYLDDGKIIESEWRGPVSTEWFDVWFARLLADGKAQLIPASRCPSLEGRLFTTGFPKHRNRDAWYVRVCKAVLAKFPTSSVPLITEDIDFYDPRLKGCAAKTRNARLSDYEDYH